MNRKDISVLAFIVLIALILLAMNADEIRHGLRYLRQARSEELRAEFLRIEVPGRITAGESLACHIAVKNSGTRAWIRDKHYFALGVFEREGGKRLEERVLFSDGTNRLIVPEKGIAPGETWQIECRVIVPSQPGNLTLHFGMVQEGVSWFLFDEKSIRITIMERTPKVPRPPAGAPTLLKSCIINNQTYKYHRRFGRRYLFFN